MANIISPEGMLGASGGEPYLTKEDKADLHNAQTPFWVVAAVAEQEGNFGVQTIFTIRAKGLEPSKLAFSASQSRINQARQMIAALATDPAGEGAVGPVYLGRWAANGKSGWQLTYQPGEVFAIPATQSESMQAATTQRVAAATADLGDSDVPY